MLKQNSFYFFFLLLFTSLSSPSFTQEVEEKIYPQEGFTPKVPYQDVREILKEKLPTSLQDIALKQYIKAREALEMSVADVVIAHPDFKNTVEEICRRTHKIIETHSEILVEEINHGVPLTPSTKEFLTTMKKNYILSTYFGFIEGDMRKFVGAGYAGSNPLTVEKVFKEGNLREKLYLVYRVGRYLQSIFPDPDLIEKINKKIHEDFSIQYERRPKNFSDPYQLGVYASFKARFERCDYKVAKKWRKKRFQGITLKNADQYLRIPLSSREKRLMRLISNQENPMLQWIPGAGWFTPCKLLDCDKEYEREDFMEDPRPYVIASDALYFPQLSSISSSADRILQSAIYLGFTSYEDKLRIRLATLWMVDTEDHSLHEILFSSKSYHLPFEFKPDFYKDIYPLDEQFVEKIQRAQRKRGYELPDFYLSKKFIESSNNF